MDDLLAVGQWQAQLNTALLGKTLVKALAETGSTNAVAMELGLAGAPAGTLVLAESQTEGRGRLGRQWHSPAGAGLYFSLVLRPRLAVAELPQITMAAGLALCQAIEEETGLAPGIKWPNDLLLGLKKFAGILVESGPVTAEQPLVILGIGINVLTPVSAFPDFLQDKATSLLAFSGRSFSRKKLLGAVLFRLEKVLDRLETEGFANILSEWQSRDALRNTWLTWLTPSGEAVRGWSLGPDANGVLHIKDEMGRIHAVLSGDINPQLAPGQV